MWLWSKRANDIASVHSQSYGLTDWWKKHRHLLDQSGHYTELNTINWRDTTQFDSEDDYRTGCRNVSHGQQ